MWVLKPFNSKDGLYFLLQNRIKLCKVNLLLPSCICRLTPNSYPLNIAQSFSFFTRPCKALESLNMQGFFTSTVPFATVPRCKKGLLINFEKYSKIHCSYYYIRMNNEHFRVSVYSKSQLTSIANTFV